MSEIPWPEDYGQQVIVLLKGERFRHPTKPGRYLHGPMVLDFTRWHDGGIDVFIREGSE